MVKSSPASSRPSYGDPCVILGDIDASKAPLATIACSTKLPHMKAKFTYWKESDGKYLGYLHSHPDHWTQGEDLEDFKAHLRDLHAMFSAEKIPGIRQVAELEVA